MALWNDKTAAEATGGQAQGQWEAARVEIDSRRIRPGDLFVALKGENFDGHAFVADALKKGAVAAVISSPHRGEASRKAGLSPVGEPQHSHPNSSMVKSRHPDVGFSTIEHREEGNFLIVPDTLKALEDLGRYVHERSKAKIVGITGSVGKTSTKEMIRLALSAHGVTYATSGNFNNHIGTPLNLANLTPETNLAVFEMGMNHAGEISHLTQMVRPDVAIITNIEAVHLEFFGTVEKIAEAKAEIFEGVPKGGTAILNMNSNCFKQLEAAANYRQLRVLRCGDSDTADCHLLAASSNGCQIAIGGKTYAVTFNAIGKHWGFNALFALAAVHALGLDVAKSAAKLAEFSEPEGRGRVVNIILNGKPIILIDDSYNASPASMRAAFDKASAVWEKEGHKGRKIAALGEMRELGATSASLHESLVPDLMRNQFDAVFTACPLMQHLHYALPAPMRGGHTATAMDLLPLLQKELCAGDILLIKGSHGSKMYELAAALQNPHEKKHAV